MQKVFITDECDEIMPNWLRFVPGVVDSQDISLNISREMLQNNPVIEKIKKGITKIKSIARLQEIKNGKLKNKNNNVAKKYFFLSIFMVALHKIICFLKMNVFCFNSAYI